MKFSLSLQITLMIFLVALCQNIIHAQLTESELITQLNLFNTDAIIFCKEETLARWAVAT